MLAENARPFTSAPRQSPISTSPPVNRFLRPRSVTTPVGSLNSQNFFQISMLPAGRTVPYGIAGAWRTRFAETPRFGLLTQGERRWQPADPRLHFGLGAATSTDIEIRWRNGRKETV